MLDYGGRATSVSILHLAFTSYLSLRKKCPYSELFWSVFSRISDWNTDQSNSGYGHFLRSVCFVNDKCILANLKYVTLKVPYSQLLNVYLKLTILIPFLQKKCITFFILVMTWNQLKVTKHCPIEPRLLTNNAQKVKLV